MPLTVETLRGPHPSIPRNPLLAEPMFLARYIERAGTGTLDVASRPRAAGRREPELRVEHGQFIQVLRPTLAASPRGSSEVKRLLQILDREPSRGEVTARLGLKDETLVPEKHRQPSLRGGLVVVTIPGKPDGRLPRYRPTPAGLAFRARLVYEGSGSARQQGQFTPPPARTHGSTEWSRLSGLNRRPTVYKTVALPLS